MGKGQVEGGKALQAARAAELDAASHRPTAAQKQQQIAELEERAVLFWRSGEAVSAGQGARAKVWSAKGDVMVSQGRPSHLLYRTVTRTSQRWDTGMCRAGREEERAAAKKAVGA